jgi:hypothetical protein
VLAAVLREQQETHAQLARQWRQRLERAQYEAHLARRQYDAVDPDNRLVAFGETVTRGQPIGTIGSHRPGEPNHLHFDISPTAVLATNPGDWPGLTWSRIVRDYLDPLSFILAHRARRETPWPPPGGPPPETGDPDYTTLLPLLAAATNTATAAAALTDHLEALTTLRDAIQS